jgi:cellulose biosynthesis protein BcsQ
VLLVDGAGQSLLPFYFGSQREAAGWFSLAPPRDSSDAGIAVMATGAGQETMTQTWRTVADAGADRLLIDAWTGLEPDSRAKLLNETHCLALLSPDLRSLVRLQQVEQQLREVDSDAPRRLHVLLSRFEPNLAMHVELRQSLARTLGDRLLPFTLRRGDEPALALAEGLTVLDYAPSSGIAEDFERLTNWLQGRPAPVRAAANGQQAT